MRTATALAMAGGAARRRPGSHRRWPEITGDDRAALARVLDSGELWGPNAPEVSALQEEWARYVGTRLCLLMNSGTAALHCGVAAAGVRPGDEVIVPAFSFVATPMAVLHAGAVPVFCDIDPLTHTIDPRRIEALISPSDAGDRARPRARPARGHGRDPRRSRAATASPLIEDAAQAHGATYRGGWPGRSATRRPSA